MKAKIMSIDGKEKGTLDMPPQFSEEKRDDVIFKVFKALEANMRQSYGSFPDAGDQHSAKLSRRRHDYKGSYGLGISRVPRKIMSHRGTRFNWVGAIAPGCVGGRRAHPPKAEKIWNKKINTKENRLAIRSALSFNIDRSYLLKQHFIVPDNYPFVLSSDYESLKKTSDVISSLSKLDLDKELERGSKKSIRHGKGKRLGRKYKKSKGPLIVVSKSCPLYASARNIAGVDIVVVDKLNVKDLSPSAIPGRITLFTESAVERMKNESLFMLNKKSVQPKQKAEKLAVKSAKIAKPAAKSAKKTK